MPAANIEINGAASSNDNLPINTLVQLSNADTGGEVTYLWEILDQPEGAADVLSSSIIENPTFTPRKEGTYLLRLTVNLGLGTEVVNTKIAAVRQMRTFDRIPAAMETTEADTAKGWKTAANRLLQKADVGYLDGNRFLAMNDANVAVGDIVWWSQEGAIKVGLPGEETIPKVFQANAQLRISVKSSLGVCLGNPNGGALTANGLCIVQRLGRVPFSEAGSPVIGDLVYVSNSAQPTLTPGTIPRAIGRVVAASGGNFTWSIDGSVGDYMLPRRNAFPNLLRNSGFWFAQRQVPGTLTTYSNTSGRALAADGWGITNENASAQYRRVTPAAPEAGLLSPSYGEVTKITSAGKLYVTQVLESIDVTGLRGLTVRLQMKLKRVTANMSVKIGVAQLTSAGAVDTIPATFISAHGGGTADPTLGTNLALITPLAGVSEDASGGVVTGGVLQALTASWATVAGHFVIPSDCKNLVVMVWSQSQVVVGNGISIAEASLSPDLEPHDWAPMPITQELQRCQRYYAKSFPETVAPATNAGLSGSVRDHASVAGAVAQSFAIRFPVSMRVAPTMTYFNPSAANNQVRFVSGALDASATATSAEHSPEASAPGFTGNAGFTVGCGLALHYTADADL